MTQAGWFIMFLSVGSVTTLLLWCICKLLATPRDGVQHIHGFEQETPDVEE